MLNISSAFAEESQHGDPTALTESLFDGEHDAGKENCYVSNMTSEVNARFHFTPLSTVFSVKLLNREDCCGKTQRDFSRNRDNLMF